MALGTIDLGGQIDRVWSAIVSFGENFTRIDLPYLAAALVLSLRAAALPRACVGERAARRLPGDAVSERGVVGAFLVGAGMNGILPARGGDALKIVLAKRSVRGSSYPAIISSFAVLAPFDTGDRPARPRLRDHPGAAAGGAAAARAAGVRHLVLGGAPAAAAVHDHRGRDRAGGRWSRYLSRRVESFWQHLKQGVAIFREPRRYLRAGARLAGGRLAACASPRSGSSSTPSTSAARSTTCSW